MMLSLREQWFAWILHAWKDKSLNYLREPARQNRAAPRVHRHESAAVSLRVRRY